MKQKIKDQLESLLRESKEYYKDEIRKRFGDFAINQVSEAVLFGAAEMGKIYIDLCRKNNIAVLAICDNDASKSGSRLNDVGVISVAELMAYPKDTPIIVTTIYDEEVYAQLIDLEFTQVFPHFYFSIHFSDKFDNPHWISSIDDILSQKNEVIRCFDILEDDVSRDSFLNIIRYRLLLDRVYIKKIERSKEEEYFDKSIIPLGSEDVFVDGGAYTGDTIDHFLEVTNGKFKSVHSFEPDSISFAKLKAYIDTLDDPRIHVYPFGLAESRGSMKFSNQGTLGSKASEAAETTVEVIDLDTLFKEGEVPTFIKLDIEGYELDALRGAHNIITVQGPKMAICIYHKPADLWQLPLVIKEMFPGYKIFVRHYSPFLYDTVCYAVK